MQAMVASHVKFRASDLTEPLGLQMQDKADGVSHFLSSTVRATVPFFHQRKPNTRVFTPPAESMAFLCPAPTQQALIWQTRDMTSTGFWNGFLEEKGFLHHSQAVYFPTQRGCCCLNNGISIQKP